MKIKFATLLIGFMALLFTGMSVQAQTATVVTDKADYSPGQYVIITGTGWSPGERVDFRFDETPKPATCVNSHDLFATADASGNIYNDQFLIKENHLGVAFVLTATGQSSELIATAFFTDAAERVTPRAGPISGSTLVNISGSGFGNPPPSYTVTFGTASPVSANRQNNNLLNAITTPAHSAGTVNVAVSGAANSTLTNGFTYYCVNPSNAVFTESIGAGSGTQTIAAREAANGFDNDSYTMTGSATTALANVTTSAASNATNDYGLASASGNVFIDNSPSAFFQIADINTSGLSNLQLSFGIYKNTLPETGSNLIIEVSSDGTSYSPLTFASLPTTSGSDTWHYRIASGSIPATANLRIRFRQVGSSTEFRIDDIRLISSPQITSQPNSSTKCVGESVTFNVTAAGTGLTYQWRKDGNNIIGANGTSFTINSLNISDAASYDVVVSGGCAPSTPSDPAILTVNTPPTISIHPANQTVTYGTTSVVYSVTTSGSPAPTYQWQVDTGSGFTNISGALSDSLTIANPTVSMSGNKYRVIVTNTCSSATSADATLTVNKANQVITWANPANITYGTLLSATQLNATVAGSATAGASAPG
ncbi:hypothetical protein GZH53_00850, partial [Flavihumibacter sp. R14]|nr:hypothetical protein [Flavihumibacter soli]